MAVRIKNRVEYDFDLPPIQLTAVRDANLYAVEKLIEYAIEHRDEVDQLAESQKGQTAEEIAAAQAELMGGATTVAELEAKLAEAGIPSPRKPMPRLPQPKPHRTSRRRPPIPADRPFRRRRPIPAARPRPDRRSSTWPPRPRC